MVTLLTRPACQPASACEFVRPFVLLLAAVGITARALKVHTTFPVMALCKAEIMRHGHTRPAMDDQHAKFDLAILVYRFGNAVSGLRIKAMAIACEYGSLLPSAGCAFVVTSSIYVPTAPHANNTCIKRKSKSGGGRQDGRFLRSSCGNGACIGIYICNLECTHLYI